MVFIILLLPCCCCYLFRIFTLETCMEIFPREIPQLREHDVRVTGGKGNKYWGNPQVREMLLRDSRGKLTGYLLMLLLIMTNDDRTWVHDTNTGVLLSVASAISYILQLIVHQPRIKHSVPATSTPSERAFSLAGRTLEERRTQSEASADSLLFLHGLQHQSRSLCKEQL